MKTLLKASTAAAVLAAGACLTSLPASAADWGVGINLGPVSFDVGSGGYCDRWGCPEDYWRYPIYYGPVFYEGEWYRGPAYYRLINGERVYWIHGAWHHDQWRGPRPEWASVYHYGPPLGLDYYRTHGFRVSDTDWRAWSSDNDRYRYGEGYERYPGRYDEREGYERYPSRYDENRYDQDRRYGEYDRGRYDQQGGGYENRPDIQDRHGSEGYEQRTQYRGEPSYQRDQETYRSEYGSQNREEGYSRYNGAASYGRDRNRPDYGGQPDDNYQHTQYRSSQSYDRDRNGPEYGSQNREEGSSRYNGSTSYDRDRNRPDYGGRPDGGYQHAQYRDRESSSDHDRTGTVNKASEHRSSSSQTSNGESDRTNGRTGAQSSRQSQASRTANERSSLSRTRYDEESGGYRIRPSQHAQNSAHESRTSSEHYRQGNGENAQRSASGVQHARYEPGTQGSYHPTKNPGTRNGSSSNGPENGGGYPNPGPQNPRR